MKIKKNTDRLKEGEETIIINGREEKREKRKESERERGRVRE